MKPFVLQVFAGSNTPVLRFFADPSASAPVPEERALSAEPIDAFVGEVEAAYARVAPRRGGAEDHRSRSHPHPRPRPSP